MLRFRSLLLLLIMGLSARLPATELTILAVRGVVGSGGDDVLIAGFEIKGSEPQKVLIVGAGPSLANANANVGQVLKDPKLILSDTNDNVLSTNGDWGGAPEIQATGQAPSDPREPALVATLPPGRYTAVLSSEDGSTGNAGLAIYDVKSLTGQALSTIEKLSGRWTGVQYYTINGHQCRWRLEIQFNQDNSLSYTRNLISDDINGSGFRRNCEVNRPVFKEETGPNGDKRQVLTVENLPDRDVFGFQINGDTIELDASWPQDFSWPYVGKVSFDGERRAAITSTIDVDGLFIEFRLDLAR